MVVDAVFISRKDWSTLLSVLAKYNNKPEPNSYSIEEYVEFLFDNANTIRTIEEHIDDVLKQVDTSKGDTIREALIHLSRNIDKTVSFFNNPPNGIKELFKKYLFYNYLHSNEFLSIVLKYVPLLDLYGDKYGVVLYPSEKEIELYTPAISGNNLLSTLDYLLQKMIKINVRDKTIRIGDEEVSADIETFISLLTHRKIKLTKEEKEQIISEATKILQRELASLGRVEITPLSVIVHLDNMIKKAKTRYNLNIEEFKAIIIFPTGYEHWYNLLDKDPFRIDLRLSMKISKTSIFLFSWEFKTYYNNCGSEDIKFIVYNSFLKTTDLSKIPDIIEKATDPFIEIAKVIYDKTYPFVASSEKYGHQFHSLYDWELKLYKPESHIFDTIVSFKFCDNPKIAIRIDFHEETIGNKIEALKKILSEELPDFQIQDDIYSLFIKKEFVPTPEPHFDDIFRLAEEIHNKIRIICLKNNIH